MIGIDVVTDESWSDLSSSLAASNSATAGWSSTCSSGRDNVHVGNVEFVELLEQVHIELYCGLHVWLMAVLEIPIIWRKSDANSVTSNLLYHSLKGLPHRIMPLRVSLEFYIIMHTRYMTVTFCWML